MTIRHVFRSGNRCEFYIPECVRDGLQKTRVIWDYPPSSGDRKEFHKHFYPSVVIPAVEALMRESRGAGRMVQVIPGIWAWKPTTAEEMKQL